MINEKAFETFLENDPGIRSNKAVKSRMAKARKAESVLGTSLDLIVADDDLMYDSLTGLSAKEDSSHSPMQNAVRKYYRFKNGKEFPKLRNYHSPMHP